MKTILIILLASFIFCFLLFLLILPVLRRLKAGQYVLSYVKEHQNKTGTPTMGGLAFIAAIIAVSLCACGTGDGIVNLTLAVTAGFMVVGFLDDFLKIYHKENEGLKPYQKIIFQFSIAVVAALYCYFNKLTFLNVPFIGVSADISWGIIPFVIFLFIATVNCVNLTDGLDGLAGGTSLCYLLFMGILLFTQNNSRYPICFIAVGALGAFLIFNTNKASVFMGDTGSLALGGLISCISVFTGNALYVPVLGITFVLSGISVIIQVIYYKRTKKRVFLMAPLHHHFQMKGYGESKISYTYFAVTAIIGIICLIFS